MNHFCHYAKFARVAVAVIALAAMLPAGAVGEGAGTGAVAFDAAPAGMIEPKYDADGKLLAPENYRKWVFVGASIGLSYNEARKPKATPEGYHEEAGAEGKDKAEPKEKAPGVFHHTYIQPEAYDHYRETGKFPEKTMLILELYAPETKVSPDKNGFSQGRRVGLEVAIKDHSHFEEGWAYFDFPLKENKPAAASRAFPKPVCFACHKQHGADDNVFMQFYPVLGEARAARQAAAGTAAPEAEAKPEETAKRAE